MGKTVSGSPESRRHLLDRLRGRPGEWVSGTDLGASLTLSRAAIWKQAAALRREGYVIEACRRRGYRLRETPDLLLPAEIRSGLRTRTLGRGEIFHEEIVDSTNRLADSLAREGAQEGTVVVAEGQTAGRGRRGRSWFSPPRLGIYVSLILRPPIDPGEAPRLSILAATAAATAVEDVSGLGVSIKWPNDLLTGGRKLGGVLTELATGGEEIRYAVVGLGLNVAVPPHLFPAGLAGGATSVLAERGAPVSRLALLCRFLDVFEEGYEALLAGNFGPVMEQWRRRTNCLGRRVTVEGIGRTWSGTAVDLDANGFLLLRDDEGRIRRLSSGDLTVGAEG
ncbi:MAG TPA: biotin--[acetyl-CoA-carboxylase] ligase [Syntrophales bacterium]|nr:biotin--[acetyl-CoA-carboxylase] ligase [Syntrophales bacterium]HOM06200.1 biotin--[acetyl-CoA-carboxylase] ligase [Syntrophales bacterium]HPC00186.1 biotin--[acetyl-CoA-carboxylase] ligase [Syntrophales bacterium]HPQ05818.1 biotin--[acetyl-CoA-carboxylase] ligase [Syntrophales bacterium]